MKLRYLEIALATVFLIIKCEQLFSVADNAWRGITPISEYYTDGFAQSGRNFNVTLNYFIPLLLECLCIYASAIWMAVGLPNNAINSRAWGKALLYTLAGFTVALAVLAFAAYLSKPFDKPFTAHKTYRQLNQLIILYYILIGYLALKHCLLYLLRRLQIQKLKENALITDFVWLFIVWLLLLGLCAVAQLKAYAFFFVLLIVSCLFITYLLNLHWLIPSYFHKQQKKRFWQLQFGVTFVINLPFNGMYSLMGAHSPFILVVAFIIAWLGQLALAIPAAFLVFSSRAEITTLKTDLNTSAARLQFLRGQINPHFLFNALNSLYGMALTERAEKTGEGIQLLGDMMRFMLHENNQEQIALSSEIAYLQNYIALQNMRLAASPDIRIEVDISESSAQYSIAPMLLVPFVENAYKHGISFQESSWIKVNLIVSNGELQFDVRNSIHLQRGDDPERQHSGIGLENVKQRLALLYPERHSLVVRKTNTEFFIYLNLQLK